MGQGLNKTFLKLQITNASSFTIIHHHHPSSSIIIIIIIIIINQESRERTKQ